MSDKDYNSEISINSYLCPNCHFAQLFEHYQSEYRREWNKCKFCGYMEAKSQTRDRVSFYLKDNILREDLISKESIENSASSYLRLGSNNNTHCSRNTNKCFDCTCGMCDCCK